MREDGSATYATRQMIVSTLFCLIKLFEKDHVFSIRILKNKFLAEFCGFIYQLEVESIYEYMKVRVAFIQISINSVPEDFCYDSATKSYTEPMHRPEMRHATVEFIAPSEYMVSRSI